MNTPLVVAQRKLHSIAGGSPDSGNPRLARLTTAQRIAYFQTPEFRDWLASERAAGREVFWLKDVDKTQAAGDIFTFFFEWRVRNKALSRQQVGVISRYLTQRKPKLPRTAPYVSTAARDALNLWLAKEEGNEGLGLLEVWSSVYWPSQIGLTRDQKLAQVTAFAPEYAQRIYPGVPDENRLLTELGVNVVIVSNGDQELAIAVAPLLGVLPSNVVGSHLLYDESGVSTGVNHSYEIFDKEWEQRPQPGKSWSFHYWLHMNRQRFGWQHTNGGLVTIAGCDGDSATTDGGMMTNLPWHSAIGNFMVDTPGEPARLAKFHRIAAKYGWTKGQFITLAHEPSQKGFRP